jgi:hypothetical protein
VHVSTNAATALSKAVLMAALPNEITPPTLVLAQGSKRAKYRRQRRGYSTFRRMNRLA